MPVTLVDIKKEYEKQKRLLDRELRRAGKVRKNFRNKKQLKAVEKFSSMQQRIDNVGREDS